MSKNLHLIPKMPLAEGQKFDEAMGCLTLAKAGVFTVDITKRDGLHDGAPQKLAPFKRLTQEEVWAMPDWDDRKMYVADHNKRDQEEAEYNKEKDAFNKKLHEELQTLSWCWETVQNGMAGKAMAHNPGLTKGLPADGEKSFTFPEVLEGGGLLWLETFTQNDPATGTVPNGLFVRALGVPKIIRAVWTDLDCKPIIGKVKVGSKVLLNIYTKGLYGQDFEIGLWSQPTENPETLLPIANKGNYRHEALTYKVQPSEENKNGISGGIMVEGKSEPRVQKIRIPVTVEPIWMFAQGKGLAIYHTIKHLDTGLYFKDYKAEAILDIGYDGVLHETVIEVTNNPLLMGSVETNVANFKPCQYTAIELINDKGEITELYKQDDTKKASSTIVTGIIAGSKKKKYSIQVDQNSNVAECRLSEKSKHTNQLTVVGEKLPSNITILNQTPTKIDFESWFDYKKINLFDYFLLTESKLKVLPNVLVKAGTCRHHHGVYVRVVPDIKWEAYILILSKTSESFAHTNMTSNKDSFGDPIVADEKGKSTRKNIFEIHQKKARETGISAKRMTKDFTGELHLKATTNGGADTHDFAVGIEDKLKTVLTVLSDVKEVLDKLSHRNEAKEGGAQKTMQKLKDNNLTGAAPVFIEFSFPTIRVGGGWYWDMDKKDGEIKCIGNIQFGFEPLIQGKGGIDLVAAAEYIPIVKPVLVALRYVKVGAQWLCDNTPVQINSELYFNLYVKGKIDIRQTIDFINSTNDKTDAKISLLLGIELGFKIKATVEKVIYTKSDKSGGEEINKVGFDGQVSAEVESGFVGIATGGRDEKGMYLQLSADFTGITLKVVGKLSIYQKGKKAQNYGLNDKFDLVDYMKDICKTEKHYVL